MRLPVFVCLPVCLLEGLVAVVVSRITQKRVHEFVSTDVGTWTN